MGNKTTRTVLDSDTTYTPGKGYRSIVCLTDHRPRYKPRIYHIWEDTDQTTLLPQSGYYAYPITVLRPEQKDNNRLMGKPLKRVTLVNYHFTLPAVYNIQELLKVDARVFTRSEILQLAKDLASESKSLTTPTKEGRAKLAVWSMEIALESLELDGYNSFTGTHLLTAIGIMKGYQDTPYPYATLRNLRRAGNFTRFLRDTFNLNK